MGQALRTLPNSSYFTLARTGYIIQRSPIAMGSETVSMRRASKTVAMPGRA
jgi:hypothetical protein